MSRLTDFYTQLKQRRVIRTAVVYVALVWGALQVAQLLDDAGFMTEQQVQWLIFAALIGFPLTLVLSWFFETPWRDRKGIAILGDIAVILAVVVGISLLAWQQYFKSFARPVLAIVKIEATDVRPDTPALGDYLARRLRLVLATRPELRVIELSSSHFAGIQDLAASDKARVLGADYLLSGTVNQSNDSIQLGLQLYDAAGGLAWSGQFEDRIVDMAQLQSGMLNALWDALPLPADALPDTRDIIATCEYPPNPDAIRALYAPGDSDPLAVLTGLIGEYRDNGLLHLERSRTYLSQLETAAPPRRPVITNLALQDLNEASKACPDHPEIARQRLLNTRILHDTSEGFETYLAAFPNDSQVRRILARSSMQAANSGHALLLAREAWLNDPVSRESICLYERILSSAPNGGAENFRKRVAQSRPDLVLPCP